jgi:hypothetical protein
MLPLSSTSVEHPVQLRGRREPPWQRADLVSCNRLLGGLADLAWLRDHSVALGGSDVRTRARHIRATPRSGGSMSPVERELADGDGMTSARSEPICYARRCCLAHSKASARRIGRRRDYKDRNGKTVAQEPEWARSSSCESPRTQPSCPRSGEWPRTPAPLWERVAAGLEKAHSWQPLAPASN